MSYRVTWNTAYFSIADFVAKILIPKLVVADGIDVFTRIKYATSSNREH
jgi:hypothetical protein